MLILDDRFFDRKISLEVSGTGANQFDLDKLAKILIDAKPKILLKRLKIVQPLTWRRYTFSSIFDIVADAFL